MFNLNQLQRPTVRIALIALFVLEVAIIAFNYSLGFTEYFGIVLLIIAFPTAYFGYHYLRLACYYDHPELKAYTSVLPTHSSTNSQALTNLQVSRLIESQDYKQYRRRIEEKKGQMEGTGQFKDVDVSISESERLKQSRMEQIWEELAQKEDQIFDD